MEKSCPFCYLESGRKIISESSLAFAIYDKFPVSPGHVLVIPNRHCSDYFELPFKEQLECLKLLNKVKAYIQDLYKPDGYNVGINIGKCAGQTIAHVHLHIIPRYFGDNSEPEGGVRAVIPDKKNYKSE
jgi:diadenosine tetraphosphate (Ap4A) HIT family hydrolase